MTRLSQNVWLNLAKEKDSVFFFFSPIYNLLYDLISGYTDTYTNTRISKTAGKIEMF